MEQKSIILFRNKSSKFIQNYYHYSSYSCSSSYSTLWSGIDEIDRILFQFYLFPKKLLHFIYYVSFPPLPVPKSYQKEYSLTLKYIGSFFNLRLDLVYWDTLYVFTILTVFVIRYIRVYYFFQL